MRTDNLQDQAVGHTKLKPNSVWHKNIGTGSVQKGNLSADIQNQLAQHGATGPRGPVGPAGPQGASGLTGAFYSVQQYAGAVGGGAIATVACDPNNDTTSQKYVAISGGVQDADNSTDMTVNTGQLPVAASFPGRMNFTTFTPKPGRLDGWIIQFGHLGTIGYQYLGLGAMCAGIRPTDHAPSHPASQ